MVVLGRNASVCKMNFLDGGRKNEIYCSFSTFAAKLKRLRVPPDAYVMLADPCPSEPTDITVIVGVRAVQESVRAGFKQLKGAFGPECLGIVDVHLEPTRRND